MAIVKMKRLRVMAMMRDREALLDALLRAGCVEIRDPGDRLADPAWSELLHRGSSDLPQTRSKLADLNQALSGLGRFTKEKGGLFPARPPVTQEDFLSEQEVPRAQSSCARINALMQEYAALTASEAHREADQAALAPWSSLDLPLEQTGSEHVLFRLCVCPSGVELGALRAQLDSSGLAAELLEVSSDRRQHYLLILCHRADEKELSELLRPYSLSVVTFPGRSGTAAENISRLDRELAGDRARQEEIRTELAGMKSEKEALQLYADQLSTEADKDLKAERILTDGTICFFEGWAPAESMDRVGKILDDLGCAWDVRDPTEEEIPEVPVKLKNNWFSRPLNMVTEMYSLPAYNGLDPNPLMAPFFILFYGIMMADMGYGILMVLMGLFLTKKVKARGTMGEMGGLLTLCGISTFILGAMTGGFFGDFIPQLLKIINPASTFEMPYLFTPLNDTMAILIGSLVLGFLQILTGMAISFVKKAKDGHIADGIWDEGSWWVIFIGLALFILKIGNVAGYPVVLIFGIVMMLVGSGRNAKGLGKLGAAFGAVYNGVTGYFSDSMSYSRLMALMLSGSIIASVFNQLGAVTGNVLGFVVISMIGNALNFALNLLGCYVHDLRLQCLEFFNRFYQDGGKPFVPLAIQTKYVDIKEEQ